MESLITVNLPSNLISDYTTLNYGIFATLNTSFLRPICLDHEFRYSDGLNTSY